MPSPGSAGYSGTPLPKKLGIREESVTVVLRAPPGFDQTLGPLPRGARLSAGLRGGSAERGGHHLTICFVQSARELAQSLPKLVAAARSGGVWIAWPKQASGIRTDLSEDVIRKRALASGLVDHKVCAIDATWSGLRFARRRT